MTEPRARFNLSIRCGNLESAVECATQLNEREIWNQLAEEALRQGNLSIVETCYQRTKSLGKLSFFYTITGNLEKLKKMLQITEKCGDVMGRYSNAMFLNDVEARINVLMEAGQLSLAYVTAKTYGYGEVAERIAEKMVERQIAVPEVSAPEELLAPPAPVNDESEWPMLEMPRSVFDRVMEEEAKGEPEVDVQEELEAEFKSIDSEPEQPAWGEKDDDLELSDDQAGGWGDDLELSEDEHELPVAMETAIPQPGRDLGATWCANSSLVFDHAASGDIDSTLQLLNRQLGVVQFSALQSILHSCYCSVQAATVGFPSMPALQTPLQRASGTSALPMAVYRIQHASQLVKMGLKCFQSGRFDDTLNAFRSFFLILPVVVAESKEEEVALKQFVDMAREYVVAVLLELARKQESDPVRNLLLSYYMTQCKLQSSHMLLALNSAMVAAFKAENFIDAAVFAKRILINADIKSPRNAALEQKTRKVLVKSEREGRNAVETGYDEQKAFSLDCVALTPIFRDEELLKCPLCGATYRAESKNKVCSVCGLAQIGVDTVGLVCMNAQK